jgi:predicted AAA+ superfamily ATPase
MHYALMINRLISEFLSKSSKSILLLGPRQAGKSTLVKSLKPDLSINFADQNTFLKYTQDFDLLKNQIERTKAKVVFIDEVQRIPELLNTVQAIVDDNVQIKFFLTGSSARKLKKSGANLLPGRVLNCSLGPLCLKELDYKFQKEDLLYGYLPGVYTERNTQTKKDILSSYSANYINEEIKAEALTRDLPSFSRFLQLSPTCVANFIDYTKFSKKAKISRQQVTRYFEIFEDTMVGRRVWPADEFIEKYDLVKHPKFYFFDVGVYNGLETTFEYASDRSGGLCEQLVYQQIYHSADALRKNFKIHSFRTRGGAEIDFLIKLESKYFGIEVKANDNIIDSDVRHLVNFKKLEPKMDYYIFHFGKDEIKKDGIWCLPIGLGLKEIGL